MNIVRTFEKFRDSEQGNNPIYGIHIVVEDKHIKQSIFINTSEIVEPSTNWININNLNNEIFLKEHGIDYILEGEDKNIIPIGLVDFTHPEKYCTTVLNVWNCKGIELHKSSHIIENIERAIKIKYRAITFINRFNDFGSSNVGNIDLD